MADGRRIRWGNGAIAVDWRVGGLAVETVAGERFEWADVLEYDPPTAFRLRWRVNPEKPPTELKVAFFADGDGTRVELIHAGWESFAETAGEEAQGYTSGGDTVLGHYVSHLDDERRSAGPAILPALRLRSPECLASWDCPSPSWAPRSSAPLPPAIPRVAPSASSGAGSSWASSRRSRSS